MRSEVVRIARQIAVHIDKVFDQAMTSEILRSDYLKVLVREVYDEVLSEFQRGFTTDDPKETKRRDQIALRRYEGSTEQVKNGLWIIVVLSLLKCSLKHEI